MSLDFSCPGWVEPAVDTVLPFLRHASRSGAPLDLDAIDADPVGGADEADAPLAVVYRPEWPQNAAELRVGETLSLPKFGLPQVRGQKSALVYYQQSVANGVGESVVLHDPTREKTVPLDAPGVNLEQLPAVLRTTSSRGKDLLPGIAAPAPAAILL